MDKISCQMHKVGKQNSHVSNCPYSSYRACSYDVKGALKPIVLGVPKILHCLYTAATQRMHHFNMTEGWKMPHIFSVTILNVLKSACNTA